MKQGNKKQAVVGLGWAVAFLLLVLAGGYFFTQFITRYGENLEELRLQALADTAAASFDLNTVLKLKGKREDIGTAGFDHNREQLMRLKKANPQARFIYLAAMRSDKLVFLADAESATSPDYSAPGDIYVDAPPGAYRIFTTRSSLIAGPYVDKWGEWVTGFTPLINPATGQVVAILGIDVNAEQWQAAVLHYRWFGMAITALVLGIVLMLVLAMYVQQRSRLRMALSNQELSDELAKRQQAEESLGRNEENLRSMFNAIDESVCLISRDGAILTANETFAARLGRIAADCVGQSIYSLIPADVAARRKPIMDQVFLTARPALFEDERQGRWLRHRIMPVLDQDGRVDRLAIYAQDITERRNQEEELKASEHRFKDLSELLPEAVFEADLSMRLTFVNRKALALFDYSEEEVEAGLNCLDMVVDEDQERARENVGQRMMGQGTGAVEYTVRRKDGSTFPALISATAITQRGKPIGLRGIIVDISELKRAELVLSESEEKYRTIIEQFSEGLILLDERGNISAWNRANEEISGLPREGVVGQPYWEVMMRFAVPEHRTPERIERVKKLTLEMLRTGQSPYVGRQIEARIIRSDGMPRYISQSVFPIKTDTGFLIGSMVRDITERKQVEEENRAKEQMIQGILSATPVGIGLTVDGKIQWVNEAWMQIFGFEDESEYLGQSTGILYPSEQAYQEAKGRVYASLENAAVGKIEALMRRRDGATFHAHISTAPINPADLKQGIISTVMDISAWKELEQSLRESEEKYRLAMDVTNDALWDWDIPAGEVHYSQAWSRILGEAIDPHISSWQARLHPDEKEAVLQSISNHLAGKTDSWSHEHRLKTSAGKWKWVLGRGSVVSRDALGKPLRMIGTLIDIDERRLLESQLTQAQKMEALGTLAGGIAHDFNNILGAIIGYTELSMMQISGAGSQDHYLQQVMKASERAKNLVDQILVFSRQREQERKPVDVKIIVREALKLLKASLPSTIEMHQHLMAEASIVNADPTQIHQIVMNLCTNAAHAMGENGGVMDISVSHLEVSLAMTAGNPDFRVGPYVHLRVADSGKGIDPAVMDKIYEPFFTTKASGEGTGLGLSVVYGIVKKYEGVIAVHSKLGEGTAFDIYLPRIMAESPAGEGAGHKDLFSGSERILIIDDEADLAAVLEKYLASVGYAAVSKTSSQEALECFRSNPGSYDLVVTDMTMPHMTGLTLSREILAIRPEVPIILCTGYDKSVNREEVLRQGIREFALKPISPRILAGLIRKVLDE